MLCKGSQETVENINDTKMIVQSVFKQKMALVAYATESDIPILSATQLDLAEKIVAVLLPIDKLTNSVSADSSLVSVIIPFVKKC